MNLAQPAVSQNFEGHLHLDSEQCPLCEQSISREKFAQISGRIAAQERDLTDRLKEQFAAEKEAANAKARAEQEQARKDAAAAIAQIRSEAVAKETAALAEGKKIAEAAMQTQIAAADAAKKSALAEIEQVKTLAAQATSTAQAELEKFRIETAAEAEKLKEAALAKETAAREEGKKAAEIVMQAQIAEALQAKIAAEATMKSIVAEAEQAKKIADQVASTAKAELEAERTQAASMAEKLKQEALAKEIAAREEGKKVAEAAAQAQLAETEQRMQTLKESQENALAQRLQEQRDALEKQAVADINAERAKAFQDKQKLEATLQDVQRQLQNKTAQELGEGAELDLFEELKREFPDDKITRVAKGAAGADVLHTVRYNGKDCGLIVYDSKNHKSWRNDFVNKLRTDQLSAKADHAILSSHVFPSGAHQLHIQDGVIVTNPARVVALVELLRRHIIQMNGLRVSNEERDQKTAAVYEFITSDRYKTLLDQIETHADSLLDLDAKEEKAHKTTWTRRGQLICDIQKVRGNLSFEVERIIGTAEIQD